MGSRIVTFAFFASLASPVWAETCREDVAWVRGDFGTARFSIDVADDASERAQGLMHVPEMPQSKGMLFVYDAPSPVAFWMKNTLIPLDMLFINENGVIEKIHANAIPHDETAIPGGMNIQYVLEINGGLSDRLGISAGDELRHPSISKANWVCE